MEMQQKATLKMFTTTNRSHNSHHSAEKRWQKMNDKKSLSRYVSTPTPHKPFQGRVVHLRNKLGSPTPIIAPNAATGSGEESNQPSATPLIATVAQNTV